MKAAFNIAAALVIMTATPIAAQGTKVCATDLPCIPGYWGRVVHDASHAGLSIVAAEALRIFDHDWNDTDRYLIGTVAVPVVWEAIDYLTFRVFAGRGFDAPPGFDSLHDPATYQAAWIVPLLHRRKYWQAGVVFVAWASYILLWNMDRGK